MTHKIFLLFVDDWIVSKIILQQKYSSYSFPPAKKNYSDLECKIVLFDISDVTEKDKEKFDEIQDINSQVKEY